MTIPNFYAVPARTLVVAAGQASCTALNIPANVTVAAALVRSAAAQGAELLVLPELFLTGYELKAIVAKPDIYTVDSEDQRLDPLAIACAETHTAVVVGAATRDADIGTLHISAVILNRNGKMVAQYDKQHIDSTEQLAGFSRGNGGCTLFVNGWRLGLGICWDASFPEHASTAALEGCHAYLVSALFGGRRGANKRAIICPARALDNAIYVVVANHIGQSGPFEGCGGSAVWDPEGSLLADADTCDPGIASAHLSPDSLTRARTSDFVLAESLLNAPPHYGSKSVYLD